MTVLNAPDSLHPWRQSYKTMRDAQPPFDRVWQGDASLERLPCRGTLANSVDYLLSDDLPAPVLGQMTTHPMLVAREGGLGNMPSSWKDRMSFIARLQP